jgi:autotransporter-associated beta strand protein
VNPDLNLINNASTPANVDVTLAGVWSIASGPANASILLTGTNATVVRLQTVHGLPVEVLLAPDAKVTPTLTPPDTSAILQGQTLASSALTGGGATNANNNTAVPGTFSFTTPNLVPSVGPTNVSVTFTPSDTTNYNIATTTVTVWVYPVGATFQWDANPSSPNAQDGSGVWGLTPTNWIYSATNLSWVDHLVAIFGVSTGSNCVVTLADDITPAGITFNATAGTYTITGTNNILTSDGLNIIANSTAAISAPMAGAGGWTNAGPGSLTISGPNTCSGLASVNRGTVNVSGNQSGATGGWRLASGLAGVGMTVSFNPGSIITVAGPSSILLHNSMASGIVDAILNVAGTVTNHGSLDVNRRGNLTLNSGANWRQNGSLFVRTTSNTSQGSSLTVNPGATFTYAGSDPIEVSPSNANVGSTKLTVAGGTFITSQGFKNATAASSGSATITLTNGGRLVLAATIPQLTSFPATNTFLSIGSGLGGLIDTSVFSTTISNVVTGSGSLTKLGSGTLTLSASNSLSGLTTVSNGALVVNGYLGAETVTAPGTTLGGSGTVGGALTVNGTIAPGSGAIGTLNTVGETWNSGGGYQFTLNHATNSSGWDLLNITGALNIQSATNTPFTIKLVSLTSSNTPGSLAGFSSTGTNVWTLATTSGGIQNFSPAKFVVDPIGFSNAFTGTFSVTTNSNSLLLTYSPASPVAPVVTSVALSGGTFSFSLSGPAGQGFHIFWSTNLALPLASWQTATSGVFLASPILYSESATIVPQKFFRVASP